jgi:hypothetical protein
MLARCALALTGGLLALLVAQAEARDLSLDERITAQRAIEQVYWNHRIWPAGNPGAKPPLSAVVSDAQIRGKVETYLAKSNALATEWQRPITAAQLQAEMNQMAANTHSPEILQELFAALGNDPFVIAETLVRQTLADGLIRGAYASNAASGDCAHGEAETDFDAWWAKHRGDALTDFVGPVGQYSLPNNAETQCSPNTWGTPTNATAGYAPEPRYGHSAVWTGAEMIVWGGNNGFGPYGGGGGRYDPATDSWGPLGGGPSLRYLHAAVWTGTEMVVWGGNDGSNGYLNTGGRYNPVADTWGTPTSTSGNCPTGREGHSAVWTGTEMIVWGGRNSGGAQPTGGRYNPATNTWGAPTSTSNPPIPREGHAAVWTGSEMIVWGGSQDLFTSPGNSGGRYNPTTDTWGPPTSVSGSALSGRIFATAVWNGTEMIIWGGTSAVISGGLNTGGRYNPSSDTWGAATSTSANCPTARFSHSAVWTGSEMIVWGGAINISNPLNTGGRYCGCSLTFYPDADGDGYGDGSATVTACAPPPGYVANSTDCNDTDPLVHPGAPDATCNGIDNNCNGTVDEGVSGCVCIARAPGLVGWWPGNDNTLDVVAGHDGTLANGAGYAAGKVGDAFNLNGVNDLVSNLGAASTFSFIENTGVFTIEAWIKLADPFAFGEQTIIGNTYTSAERGFFFVVENPHSQFGLALALSRGQNGVPIIVSNSPNNLLVDSGWHHVAATGNGTNVTFYVDGVAYPGSGTMVGPMGSGDAARAVDMGWDSNPGTNYFGGEIDELAIYNRALNSSEIRAIYNAGSIGMCRLGPLAVDGPATSARTLAVADAWPNPAERATNIEFQLPARDRVSAEVVDVAGRRVSMLLQNGILAAGTHRLEWDGRDAFGRKVVPGIYLIRISTSVQASSQKIVMVN